LVFAAEVYGFLKPGMFGKPRFSSLDRPVMHQQQSRKQMIVVFPFLRLRLRFKVRLLDIVPTSMTRQLLSSDR